MIHTATLNAIDFVPYGTSVNYYLSADGGAHWEPTTPGIELVFANPGSDLRWRAELIGPTDRSVHIYEISIDYFYNLVPSAPAIYDPGTVNTSSSFIVTWNASTDDAGVDHYELQLDDEAGFAIPINTYVVAGLSQNVTILTNGTYYFRVRAVDIWGLPSDWSDVVDIDMIPESPGLKLEWWVYVIIGGGLVLIVGIILIVVFVRRRKVVPVR